MIQELTRIVQAVSHAVSLDDQIRFIVESIRQAMAVEVCSLYMVNPQDEMVLLASHGLPARAVRRVKLPPGQGLIGLAAATRQPVNVADAGQHPAYYHVPEAKEEHFHGFCAVPLVNRRKVVGVLAVQSSETRQFSSDEEGFLVTLAAQVALLLENAPFQPDPFDTDRPVTGTSGVPGVAIGSSHLCDLGELYDVPDEAGDDVASTLAEWHELLKVLRRNLRDEARVLGHAFGEEVRGVFKAYETLSTDPAFIDDVERRILAGNSLPSALRQTTQHFADLFVAMEDPYLQARHEDIHDLGNKLFRIWRGAHVTNQTRGDVVLVGQHVSVSDIASVTSGQLKGIVCYRGSRLSHTAVLANALGVPAVMGTGPLSGITEGATLVVDGYHARVWINPSETVLAEYRELIEKNRRLNLQFGALRDEPACTTDSERINLYTNTGLLTDISPGLKSGAQGVGLYRTEIPFMLRDSFPSEEEQVQVYRQVLEAYRGKPVYMRTLDIGADKQLPYFHMDPEENPALGWRGIRFSLDNSQVLITQIRAMLKAAEGLHNLHILLPLVTSVWEIDEFHALLTDAHSQLLHEGIEAEPPPVGIMLEVPAAISQIAFFAGKIDFLSIGSNDLSQYLLAADRNNARIASRYHHLHPAVLHEIARILAGARDAKIPVSLCGEMASDPAAVVLLIGMGLRNLSMSAARLPLIKWLIRKISLQEARAITEKAMHMHDSEAIRSLLDERLEAMGLPGVQEERPQDNGTTGPRDRKRQSAERTAHSADKASNDRNVR